MGGRKLEFIEKCADYGVGVLNKLVKLKSEPTLLGGKV